MVEGYLFSLKILFYLFETLQKRQRSGRKSGDREYIPAYRSGPYALLLTLYRDMQVCTMCWVLRLEKYSDIEVFLEKALKI